MKKFRELFEVKTDNLKALKKIASMLKAKGTAEVLPNRMLRLIIDKSNGEFRNELILSKSPVSGQTWLIGIEFDIRKSGYKSAQFYYNLKVSDASDITQKMIKDGIKSLNNEAHVKSQFKRYPGDISFLSN